MAHNGEVAGSHSVHTAIRPQEGTMPESTNPSVFLQGGEATTGALNAVAVFAGIDRLSLNHIEARSRFVEVRDGAQILKQGDAADAIYAVISGGRVRVVTTSRDKGLMVQMFHAGDILGEMGVIDGGVRSADAYTEGRVRLLQNQRPDFPRCSRRTSSARQEPLCSAFHPAPSDPDALGGCNIRKP